MKQRWPAPDRNKQPILQVLERILPATGTLLEVASGSGQHAVFFAQQLPQWRILPSDMDPDNLASIRAWVSEAGLPNLMQPLELDVLHEPWSTPAVDALFNANMIHIAPYPCCQALMRGAAGCVRPSGLLIMYGPYRIAGAHTSQSNEEFDAGLRARDPRWGVRDLEQVVAEAEEVGFVLRERVAMPANNQTLVFQRNQAG